MQWTAGTGWSAEETVVAGLAWTFGWTAAAHAADERTVVWVEDGDADYRTEGDREVFAVGSDAGGWSAPVALSSNALVDDSPHAYYDSLGVPMVLWRSGNQVVSGSPSGGGSVLAFTTPDPSMDDGISAAFARARVAGGADQQAVLRPGDAGALALPAASAPASPGRRTACCGRARSKVPGGRYRNASAQAIIRTISRQSVPARPRALFRCRAFACSG